jgi:DDE superfamily endonuclease
MNVPPCAIPVLTMFRPAFSAPTYHRFIVLVLAAVLTTGRRTVTNLLRTVRDQAPGHASSYHRVFSQRRWSAWGLARALIAFLLDHVVPPGPVLLAGDDTVTEHPGPKVFGKGRHRDGVRSTHSYTAYRWGHKWVVVSVLVKLPFATRPWALPVLAALYRPPEWDRVHRTRHKTPAHIARLLLARLIRWFPARHFIFVGDSGYGTSETARFCRTHRRHLTLVSKFYGDAALYEPPPPRTRGTMGRPRVKGQKLASPQAVVAQTTMGARLPVAWYGGTTRAIECVTGTGHWYRIGEALVAVRWVYVHDVTGTHRDEYLFSTDLRMSPQQIVECYTQRWSIETTFQECREYLKLESTKCYSQQTVLRFAPCLFGLYTIIILLYLQLPDSLHFPAVLSWHGKSTVTFSDMMMCVRRALWQQWFFQTPMTTKPFSKLPRSLQETILYALAPAA